MFVVSEDAARSVIGPEDALEAVERTFRALGGGKADNYPVVREATGHLDAVFGVKSGFDRAAQALGLKAGGYWPRNMTRALANHSSATLLFNQDTGALDAIVSANYLTGMRTAAASALALRILARPDARVLGIVGTGGQALYQLRAALSVRPMDRVLAWNRSEQRGAAFRQTAAEVGIEVRSTELEVVAREADILILVTSSNRPLLKSSWVRPGTHICAMGADTKGKQELPTDLVGNAAVYVDSIEQALSIGECQHAFADGRLSRESIRGTLADLVLGKAEGRRDAGEITIFDGTGVALQDLSIAKLALDRALEKNLAVSVPL